MQALGEDAIETVAAIRFVNGVAERDVRFDAMQKQVHQRETVEPRIARMTRMILNQH